LFLDYDGSAGIALLLGAIDHPARFVPTHHYGIESRLPWVDLQKELPGNSIDINPLAEHGRGVGFGRFSP